MKQNLIVLFFIYLLDESILTKEITRTEFTRLIKKKLDEHDLNLRKASTEIGISPATLSRILNDTTVPNIKTLDRLSRWLDIPIEQLIPVSLEKEPYQMTLFNSNGFKNPKTHPIKINALS